MKYETPVLEIVALGADTAMAADTEVEVDAGLLFSRMPNA